MTEKEKEAIDILENCIADYVIGDFCCGKYCPNENMCKENDCPYETAIDTVVELIQKQEKIIDKMAKKLNQYGFFVVEPVNKYDPNGNMYLKAKTVEEIKQYFERQVKDE